MNAAYICSVNYDSSRDIFPMIQRIVPNTISKAYKLLQGEYTAMKVSNLAGEYALMDSISIRMIPYQEDRVLEFFTPYCLKYQMEDGRYVYHSESLDIYSYGETIEELKSSFMEDIIVAWKLYVDCQEDELSNDAKLIRRELTKLLKKVPLFYGV